MKLFEPIVLGRLEIKNRIVMPAMHLGYCEDGYINERIINFYRERAIGEAGLIVVGGCSVDLQRMKDMIGLYDDDFISGHLRLTSAIKEHGARSCAQLYHPGRYARAHVSGLQPVSASAIASTLNGEIPSEMTLEDIAVAIESFSSAARRAVLGGYDMVEIIASAGYLICQFLSPLTNKRKNRYGGNFENRLRFGLEVVTSVREAIGHEVPLIIRLSGNEYMPGGSTHKEIVHFAKLLEQVGADAIDVTGGWHETRVPQITMRVPNGAYVYLAQSIKQSVRVPVIACNRINNPWLAEEILIHGQADMVGIARGLIADPEFSLKAREGRFDEIRQCIGCNQGCLDNVFDDRAVVCLVNSRAGKEEETEINPTECCLKVLVIGGGPAGMEAARLAALRGHQVSLWEKADALGGQLRLAARPPGRNDFYHLIDNLEKSIYKLGVDVRLKQEATLERINAFAPEVIVVATGAQPRLPSIPGIDLDNVAGAWDVLEGKVELGENVVIIGGGATGCEIGLYIAEIGTLNSDIVKHLLINNAESVERIKELITQGTKKVTILEMESNIGKGFGRSTKWGVDIELQQMGVKIYTSVVVEAIEKDGVIIKSDMGEHYKIPADSVVIAVGTCSQNSLYENLKDEYSQIFIIGDAQCPRTALEAIREGFEIGNSI